MAHTKKGRAAIRPKTSCATKATTPKGRFVHCITQEMKLAVLDFVEDVKGTPFEKKMTRREVAMTVAFLTAMTVASMVLEPMFRGA